MMHNSHHWIRLAFLSNNKNIFFIKIDYKKKRIKIDSKKKIKIDSKKEKKDQNWLKIKRSKLIQKKKKKIKID